MFDVAPDEIKQLNDADLRELIGRLCEAELASRGLSPVAVTWGGNQTAADGGLDVRVAFPPDTCIDGFVPRVATGFQAKTPDMPRKAILREMRPAGEVRPVIQELANEGGAYVIVNSHGSTADIALRNRRNALRDALKGVENADQLYTDFYDRTRLATWVRRHAGTTPTRHFCLRLKLARSCTPSKAKRSLGKMPSSRAWLSLPVKPMQSSTATSVNCSDVILRSGAASGGQCYRMPSRIGSRPVLLRTYLTVSLTRSWSVVGRKG